MEKSNFKKVSWGDIFYCDLGNMKGSVQCGRRPVIVVQTNKLNSASPTATVAVITSVRKKRGMETHVEIGEECGLKEPSMIMFEQIRTVDKEKELREYIGSVTNEEKVIEIQRGLKFALGIPMKPKQKRVGRVLSLCPHCQKEFMVSENIVKRIDPFQAEKELCDQCRIGYGYDYLVMKKCKRGKDNVHGKEEGNG